MPGVAKNTKTMAKISDNQKQKRYMKIRLFYSDIPFWRAEVSRLALYIGKIEFEDVRLSWKDDFKKMVKGC